MYISMNAAKACILKYILRTEDASLRPQADNIREKINSGLPPTHRDLSAERVDEMMRLGAWNNGIACFDLTEDELHTLLDLFVDVIDQMWEGINPDLGDHEWQIQVARQKAEWVRETREHFAIAWNQALMYVDETGPQVIVV